MALRLLTLTLVVLRFAQIDHFFGYPLGSWMFLELAGPLQRVSRVAQSFRLSDASQSSRAQSKIPHWRQEAWCIYSQPALTCWSSVLAWNYSSTPRFGSEAASDLQFLPSLALSPAACEDRLSATIVIPVMDLEFLRWSVSQALVGDYWWVFCSSCSEYLAVRPFRGLDFWFSLASIRRWWLQYVPVED